MLKFTDMNPSVRLATTRAFSLVELLVVIAVIAIIAGIGIPQLIGIRDSAREARRAAIQEERERFVANVKALGAQVFDNGKEIDVNTLAEGDTITFGAYPRDVIFTYRGP
ncbi:MAG: prepilin-type N-terminal cleavage/methylation domain-containing protein [Chthoniobacterales bacterium]|nr:prepilin-type N-terminal cleavage/methylation domain-containing protein [Chthoniobacterales bacterium]